MKKRYTQAAKKIGKKISKLGDVVAVVLHGSCALGDFAKKLSDIDLFIITKKSCEKTKKKIKGFIYKNKVWHAQALVFSEKEYSDMLKKRDPLAISVLYKSVPIYGKEFFNRIDKKKYLPDEKTKLKLLLNAFSALGLAMADLDLGMVYDALNHLYHASRSALWALLLDKEVFPGNKRILKILKDKRLKEHYKKILKLRENPKLTKKETALKEAEYIVSYAWKRVRGKNLIKPSELRKNYKPVIIFVEKNRPFYFVREKKRSAER